MDSDSKRITLLLTRPQEEAEETAFFLRQKGIQVVFLPLFAPLEKKLGPPLCLDKVQAVVATSRRAVQAFAEKTSCRTTPLYAVGDRTATLAQQRGFDPVVSADGDAHDLLVRIVQACLPEKGPLLYISGAHINHDLPALLRQKGFDVIHEILYEMVPLVETLPESLMWSFKQRQIWGTLLFSPQTALSFSRLMRQAGLREICEIGYLFCLSQAVAEVLSPLNGTIKIAKKPKQASLLEIVYETILLS